MGRGLDGVLEGHRVVGGDSGRVGLGEARLAAAGGVVGGCRSHRVPPLPPPPSTP